MSTFIQPSPPQCTDVSIQMPLGPASVSGRGKGAESLGSTELGKLKRDDVQEAAGKWHKGRAGGLIGLKTPSGKV